MTEFPVDVLGIIKTMTLRSIGNPNALVYTMKSLLYTYNHIIFITFLLVIIRFLIKFLYKILLRIKESKKEDKTFIKFLYDFFKNFKENWKNRHNFLIKKDIKEIYSTEKKTLKILKYPLIGSILEQASWTFVSIIFRFYSKYSKSQSDIIYETLPKEEYWIIGMRATYSVCFFIIAGFFIGLSFGNKMVRNIGILLYIIGIIFTRSLFFLTNGAISNGLNNLNI